MRRRGVRIGSVFEAAFYRSDVAFGEGKGVQGGVRGSGERERPNGGGLAQRKLQVVHKLNKN